MVKNTWFSLTAVYYFDTETAVQAQELAGFHTKKERWKYIQMTTNQTTESCKIQCTNESSRSMVKTALKIYKDDKGPVIGIKQKTDDQNISQNWTFSQLNGCPEHVAISTNFVGCNFIEDRKSENTTLNFKNSQLEEHQEINLKKNFRQSQWGLLCCTVKSLSTEKCLQDHWLL